MAQELGIAEELLQQQQDHGAEQHALGQAQQAAGELVDPAHEGEGQQLLQQPRQQAHGDEHAQEEQHIAGDVAPGRFGDEGEVRGQHGVEMVGDPEAAHDGDQPGDLAHEAGPEPAGCEGRQDQHDDDVENILSHKLPVGKDPPAADGAAGSRGAGISGSLRRAASVRAGTGAA